MANWHKEDIERWQSGTMTILRAMLPDFPKADGDEANSAREDYDALFRDAFALDDMDITVDNAFGEFQKFLLSNYVRPGQHKTEFLQVSITRTIGAEEVTYSLGSQFEIGSGAGRTAKYDTLVDAINVEFKRYERDRARMPPPNSVNHSGTELVGDIVTVPALRLEVTIKDGKRKFDVKCGQWSKHGVPFYDEHIRMGGVEPLDIPLEGWDLSKYNAVVQVEKGVPKRVLKLVKNA